MPSAFVAIRRSGNCFAPDREKRTSHRSSELEAEASIEHWNRNSLPPGTGDTGRIIWLIRMCLI